MNLASSVKSAHRVDQRHRDNRFAIAMRHGAVTDWMRRRAADDVTSCWRERDDNTVNEIESVIVGQICCGFADN